MARLGILTSHAALLAIAFATYLALSAAGVASFGAPMSALDTLYFSVVTQSTVGYGDILPQNAVAKVLVMAHIAASLLVTVACTTSKCRI